MKKILSLALAGVFCLGLTACGEGEHEHEFSAWTATESGHERVCECGERESGEHTFEGGICKVCSFAEPKKEEPDNKEPNDESGDKTPDDTTPDDESGNKEPEESTEPEVPHMLTEEEWRTALSEENFENVTVTYQPLNDREYVAKFDGNKIYNQSWSSSGLVETYYLLEEFEFVYYRKYEGEEWSVNRVVDEQQIEGVKGLKYRNSELLIDKYNDVSYDEETNKYYAESDELISSPTYPGYNKLEVSFKNGRLESFMMLFVEHDYYSVQTYRFSDYGTTVVELPDVEIPELEVPHKFTEEEWRAALAAENFENFTLKPLFSTGLYPEKFQDMFVNKYDYDKVYFAFDADNEFYINYACFEEDYCTVYSRVYDSTEDWEVSQIPASEYNTSIIRTVLPAKTTWTDSLLEHYSDFVYNEEKNSYFAENIELGLFGAAGRCEIFFKNGRLEKLTFGFITYLFYDYGTTVVELPEIA